MAIQIGNYNFDGPYGDPAMLKDQSGVYAVLGRGAPNSWNVIDIGESGQVRSRVQNHDRADCWKRRGTSGLAYAAGYCNERDRMQIEKELRGRYDPPCGDR